MPRGRVIKPSFWTSRSVCRVSRDARLTFVGLWNFADELGFYPCNARKVLGDLYSKDESATEEAVSAWIVELACAGLVLIGRVQGEKLMQLPGALEHFRRDHPGQQYWVGSSEIDVCIREFFESVSQEKSNSLTDSKSVQRVCQKCLDVYSQLSGEGLSPRNRSRNRTRTRKKRGSGSVATAHVLASPGKAEEKSEETHEVAPDVWLTTSELAELQRLNGKKFADRCLTLLSERKELKGYTYENDYLAIKKWVMTAVREEGIYPQPEPLGSIGGPDTELPSGDEVAAMCSDAVARISRKGVGIW